MDMCVCVCVCRIIRNVHSGLNIFQLEGMLAHEAKGSIYKVANIFWVDMGIVWEEL